MLLILIVVATATRIIEDPVIKIQTEIITPNKYERHVDEVLRLDYYQQLSLLIRYLGVYGIELRKRVNGSIEEGNLNLNDFEAIEEDLRSPQTGCLSQQREIKIQFQLQLQLGSTFTRENFFTDIATVEDQNRVYIVRNDYELFEIDLGQGLIRVDVNPYQKSFAELMPQPKDLEVPYPFMVDDKGQHRIYILTNLAGVSFNSTNPLSETEIVAEEGVQKRIAIHDVHYNANHKALIVAAGQEGIDIYDIGEGKIVHRNQLTSYILGYRAYNIIDADSNEDQTILVLLDKEFGLLFFNIADISHPIEILQIPISNARSFDHYGSTYFVVARTQNKQDYAVEIYVDLGGLNYYFNTFYIDDMTINQVNVFQHYAVIIGEDAHKIVYHSIYNGFLSEDTQSHTFFEAEDLFKVKEYDFINQETSAFRLMVGIARHSFKFFDIELLIPRIKCQFDKVGYQEYSVILNSTQCNGKTNDDYFTQCSVQHIFGVNATQIPGNYGYYTKMTLITYVLFVILVWAIVVTYALCRKWGHMIQFLKWRRTRAMVAAPYLQEVDAKDTEMPQVSYSQYNQ